MDKGIYVYDIETLFNFFSYSAINRHTNEVVQFVIWKEKNDLPQLLNHLKECKGQVGFNCLNFDYPVIHCLLQNVREFKTLSGEQIANELYLQAQSLIKQQWSAVKETEVKIPQLDLFRIWHFDNKAKITNLKKLEINMDMDDVQDLPYHHSEEIKTQEQVDKVLSYNLHDVKATLRFYELTKDKISLRAGLQKKYDLPCLNYPDSKIGEQLMFKLYCANTGKSEEKVRKMRTHRRSFHFADCIPSYIKFQTEEFKGLLNYLKGIEVKEIKDSFHYEFTYNELTYFYGTGGLHACTKAGIYESNNKYIIVDADIVSMYPSIAVTLNLYPEHLGDRFSYIYEQEILQPRLDAKKRGDKVMSESLKLALNSVYGKSNSEYSFLYDPLYTLKTTVAGQLILSMLAEMLLVNVPELEVIQANTDGITVRIPVEHKNLYWEICKQWEKRTMLQLEYVSYSKIVLRDVNTYISVGLKDGKIKYKGALRPKQVMKDEQEWHKNFSQDVVTQSVVQYFLNSVPVEKTIKENKNIFDFCKTFNATHGWKCETLLSKEVDKTYETTKGFYLTQGWIETEKDFFLPPKENKVKNVRIIPITKEITRIEYNIKQEQKTNRFYISNKGKTFRKIKDGKIIEVEAGGKLVTILNKFEEKDWSKYDINYPYYENEAMKIIWTIDGTTEKLEQEAKEQREKEKLQREEENFVKFILNKIPTQRQYDLYKKDWLIAKHGEPKEIKISRVKENVNN